MSVAPRVDHAAAIEEFGQVFKRTQAALRRLRGRETHRLGDLSFAQYGLLFTLSERGEMPARELACAADLSPATVTEMLDGLAAAGLVDRVRSDRDKRIVLTSLTDPGARLVADKRRLWEQRWHAALAGFDGDELAIAGRVLDRVGAMFEAAADPEPQPGQSVVGPVGEKLPPATARRIVAGARTRATATSQ